MDINEKRRLKKIVDKNQIKPCYIKNIVTSFIFGGLLCIIGQVVITVFKMLGLTENVSNSLMSVSFIIISSVLTGFGIYDRFGAIAKAGSFVPITGFSNSMTSAALEAKTEGVVLGIAANMFKVAGSVITIGIVSAYAIGLIRYLVMLFI